MCQNLQQNITPGSDSHFMKQGEKSKQIKEHIQISIIKSCQQVIKITFYFENIKDKPYLFQIFHDSSACSTSI